MSPTLEKDAFRVLSTYRIDIQLLEGQSVLIEGNVEVYILRS